MAPRQTSIQLTDETRRQIEDLATKWGLSTTRNATEVITRCIERVWTVELASDRYRIDR
jgi:predicted DNA-binding protein